MGVVKLVMIVKLELGFVKLNLCFTSTFSKLGSVVQMPSNWMKNLTTLVEQSYVLIIKCEWVEAHMGQATLV